MRVIYPYGYVYKITNNINGKTYIGQRKLSLDKSWRQYMGSGVLLRQAIDKYGSENFTKTFVKYANSQEKLNKLEISYINSQKEINKAEYNIATHTFQANDKKLINLKFKKYMNNQISKAMKKSNKYKKSRKIISEINEKKRQKLIEKYESEVLRLYKKHFNMNIVSKMLGISNVITKRILKENNVELNHQNKKGRTLSQETKNKISSSMKAIEYKSKICVLCNMKFKSQAHNAKYCEKCKKKANNSKSNRINISKDELHELYIVQNMSISQIATHFKCSNRTIYNRVNEFNITLKKNYNSCNQI